MEERPKVNVPLVVFIMSIGMVLAVANVGVLLTTVPRPTSASEVPPLRDLYMLCPPCVLYFIAAPLLLCLLLAILVRRRSVTGAPSAAKAATTAAASLPTPPSPASALRLLAILQQEGRFVDFIAEDIDTYSDSQVGAAVRAIHANCRKALNERVELQRIFTAEEGSEVVIQKDFDPAAVRLTGNVAGEPPFRGTLQHTGWRAAKITLPESPGAADPNIIAPAEVEVL